MQLTKDQLLANREAELLQALNEEDRLSVRLRVAIKVENKPLVDQTQTQVELLTKTIDELKKEIEALL